MEIWAAAIVCQTPDGKVMSSVGMGKSENSAIGAQAPNDRRSVKMTCPTCNGVGYYMYDENHGKPCEGCCPHDKGWWLLEEHYGGNNGKYCCKRGCGHVIEAMPCNP